MNSLITPSSGNTEMNSLITSDTEMNSLITTGGKILLINQEVSDSIPKIVFNKEEVSSLKALRPLVWPKQSTVEDLIRKSSNLIIFVRK